MPGRVRSAGPTIVDVQPWRRVPVRDLTEETALQRLIVVFQHRRQVIGSVYARSYSAPGMTWCCSRLAVDWPTWKLSG